MPGLIRGNAGRSVNCACVPHQPQAFEPKRSAFAICPLLPATARLAPPRTVAWGPGLLDATHLVIGPVLEIAHRQYLQEWISPDEFLTGGPPRHVSGGHEGGGVGMVCTG